MKEHDKIKEHIHTKQILKHVKPLTIPTSTQLHVDLKSFEGPQETGLSESKSHISYLFNQLPSKPNKPKMLSHLQTIQNTQQKMSPIT